MFPLASCEFIVSGNSTSPPRGCATARSEEHTSELQSRLHLVCRLLLEKKKNTHAGAGGLPARDDSDVAEPVVQLVHHDDHLAYEGGSAYLGVLHLVSRHVQRFAGQLW